jgi:Domain of unknown function (DUF4286)
MLSYEVTLELEPGTADQVQAYMLQEHIPEIYSTGCFQRIRLHQVAPLLLRTSYEARIEADLQRYLQDHAPRMRAEFQARFPSGVTLTRQTWTQLQCWE